MASTIVTSCGWSPRLVSSMLFSSSCSVYWTNSRNSYSNERYTPQCSRTMTILFCHPHVWWWNCCCSCWCCCWWPIVELPPSSSGGHLKNVLVILWLFQRFAPWWWSPPLLCSLSFDLQKYLQIFGGFVSGFSRPRSQTVPLNWTGLKHIGHRDWPYHHHRRRFANLFVWINIHRLFVWLLLLGSGPSNKKLNRFSSLLDWTMRCRIFVSVIRSCRVFLT